MLLNSDTPGFEPGIFTPFISPRCTVSYVSFPCLSVQALLKRTWLKVSSGVWSPDVRYVIIVVFHILLVSLASSHQTSFADLRLFPRIQHSFILISRRRRWSRRRNVVAAACYLWVFLRGCVLWGEDADDELSVESYTRNVSLSFVDAGKRRIA